jgi:hypothetical protein
MADQSDLRGKIISAVKSKPCSVSELCRTLKVRRDFLSGYLEAMRHNGNLKVTTIGKSKVYLPR